MSDNSSLAPKYGQSAYNDCYYQLNTSENVTLALAVKVSPEKYPHHLLQIVHNCPWKNYQIELWVLLVWQSLLQVLASANFWFDQIFSVCEEGEKEKWGSQFVQSLHFLILPTLPPPPSPPPPFPHNVCPVHSKCAHKANTHLQWQEN